MLSYNKFGVTKNDIIGTWSKTGGGGVEYYNAYTGNYTGMSAISSTDEFVFNSNDTISVPTEPPIRIVGQQHLAD